MKWYRDKKFIVGNVAIPVGAAFFTGLLTLGVAIVGWLYFTQAGPNLQTIVTNNGITTQGQTGNNTFNNITQRHFFSSEQHIIPFPDFAGGKEGGKKVLELDNVATLTIPPFVFPTRDRAVLVLDFIATPVPLTPSRPNFEFDPNLFRMVQSQGPIYVFDAQHIRQEISVGGRIFVVTLKGVNNIRLPEFENAFEFVFMVSEK